MLAVLLGAGGPMAAAAEQELPLVRVPAAPGSQGPMLLLLSGDGDWAAFVRDVAETAAAHGAPVLGFKSRSYFATRRTPDESAAALAPAVRAQLSEWKRADLVIVGYSRGADLVPFIVSRWPDDLTSHIREIVLIGFGDRASFEFHLEDLVRDVVRPEDVPTRPEVEKLAGIPLFCVRGEQEQDSGCEDGLAGMRTVVHGGGHRATVGDGTRDIVLRELGLLP